MRDYMSYCGHNNAHVFRNCGELGFAVAEDLPTQFVGWLQVTKDLPDWGYAQPVRLPYTFNGGLVVTYTSDAGFEPAEKLPYTFNGGLVVTNDYKEFAVAETLPYVVAAEALTTATSALINYWLNNHRGQHVVVLGRAAWPLVPLLRQAGIAVSYFIFSRSQIKDEGTKTQWLKEVPKNSLVVDTGYAGRIFDAIKEFDSSINGVLLYSAGKYPQVNHLNREMVEEIEDLPKVTGSGQSIDEKGRVKCGNRDNDESFNGLTPAKVVQLNKLMCSALEIDHLWASFTGITPQTRIDRDLKNWYDYVKSTRQ